MNNLAIITFCITLISTISLSILAVIGVINFRNRYGHPLIHLAGEVCCADFPPSAFEKQIGSSLFDDFIRFSQPISDRESPKWSVNKISIFKSSKKWISEPGKAVRDHEIVNGSYRMVGYRHKEWKKTIKYEIPFDKGIILLHPDSPSHIKLLFHVTLKSNPRVKRKVHAEVTIPDPLDEPWED